MLGIRWLRDVYATLGRNSTPVFCKMRIGEIRGCNFVLSERKPPSTPDSERKIVRRYMSISARNRSTCSVKNARGKSNDFAPEVLKCRSAEEDHRPRWTDHRRWWNRKLYRLAHIFRFLISDSFRGLWPVLCFLLSALLPSPYPCGSWVRGTSRRHAEQK